MSQVHPDPSNTANSNADTRKSAARRLASLFSTGLRRALYPLLALPVSLLGLVLMLVGQIHAVDALHRWLAQQLLDVPVARSSRTATVTYSLVSLPANVVAFIPAGYLWTVLLVNVGYPLRPDTTAESLETSWGGPTLAGAWAFHAVGGVVFFLLIGVPILGAIGWLQGRLVRRMLGQGVVPAGSAAR